MRDPLFELAVKGAGRPATLRKVVQTLLRLEESALEMHPLLRQIAGWSGVTDRSLRRAFRSLEELGALRIEVRPGIRRRIFLDRDLLQEILHALPA